MSGARAGGWAGGRVPDRAGDGGYINFLFTAEKALCAVRCAHHFGEGAAVTAAASPKRDVMGR